MLIAFTLINHQHILHHIIFLYLGYTAALHWLPQTLMSLHVKRVVCYLLFVQMKVTYEHFTDMTATTSVPNAFNYAFFTKITTVVSKW
jgi:hypothetical protein